MGILTLVSVYALILVGGIVRSSGSGMGCPDWPKCFGSFIPPSHISQLPDDYKEVYTAKRIQKNERVAKILNAIGLESAAKKILSEETIFMETDFNPVKTKIEYLNRLLGVLVGFFIVILTIQSFRFIKSNKSIFWQTFTVLILVILEGWLGSLIVSTNLLPFTITIHMALALLIAFILINALVKVMRPQIAVAKNNFSLLRRAFLFLIILTSSQLLVGTQVREQIDLIAFFNSNRMEWINQLNAVFSLHQVIAVAIFVLLLLTGYLLVDNIKYFDFFGRLFLILLGIVGVSMLTGILLATHGFPPVIQPIHLLAANLLIGVQYLIFLLLPRFNVRYSNTK